MSTLLRFPTPWVQQQAMATGTVDICASAAIQTHRNPSLLATAVHHIQRRLPQPELVPDLARLPDLDLVPELEPALVAELLQNEPEQNQLRDEPESEPINTWAFYRKHTENLLRRYLYASMQVGRNPNLLSDSVGRGWVSSRRLRTFEDALIFVLDVERCLSRLSHLDRQLINRRAIQEYTHQETAVMLGLSLRTVNFKFPQALDHLTEILVSTDLLVLPD
jgi:hypothetical protein